MSWDSAAAMIKPVVTFQDIRDCFGIQGTDLETLMSRCNPNKWARFKPVVSSTRDTVTGQFNKTTKQWIDLGDGTNWWVAGGKCGLNFAVNHNLGALTSSTSFLYKLANGQLPWTYTKPSGGVNALIRAQDFGNYFHEAVPPVGALAGAGGTIYVPSSGTGTRTLTLNYDSPPLPEYNLTLRDFYYEGTRFTEYYLAVLLWMGSRWICASSVNKIGSAGSTLIETEIGYSDVGTWNVIPFLSSVNINAYGEQVVGNYFSAGYDTPDTITIASSGSVEQIEATGIYSKLDKTQIAFKCTLHNNGSSAAYHPSGLTIYIYRTDEGASSGATGELVAQWAYGNAITVPANGTYTLPENIYIAALYDYFCGTKDVTAPAAGKMYWITARFNDSTILDNEWMPVEEGIMPV